MNSGQKRNLPNFCARANKPKNKFKRTPGQRKFIGEIVAKEEDNSIRAYEECFMKHDIIASIRLLSNATTEYNIEKFPSERNLKMKKEKYDIKKLKTDRNVQIREGLAILKEKAKEDYLMDLHDAEDKYNCCDGNEMEQTTQKLKCNYDKLTSVLDCEYNKISDKPKISKYPTDPTPRSTQDTDLDMTRNKIVCKQVLTYKIKENKPTAIPTVGELTAACLMNNKKCEYDS